MGEKILPAGVVEHVAEVAAAGRIVRDHAADTADRELRCALAAAPGLDLAVVGIPLEDRRTAADTAHAGLTGLRLVRHGGIARTSPRFSQLRIVLGVSRFSPLA